MINLNTRLEELQLIAHAVENMPYQSIEDFSSLVFRDYNTYLDSSFGFNREGFPDFNKILSIVVHIRRYQKSTLISIADRYGNFHLGVSYCRNATLNQIYLTTNTEKYQVHTLGRSFTLSESKHPEFFLSEENASYAILLGEEVIYGLPEYLQLIKPIAEFSLMLELIHAER